MQDPAETHHGLSPFHLAAANGHIAFLEVSNSLFIFIFDSVYVDTVILSALKIGIKYYIENYMGIGIAIFVIGIVCKFDTDNGMFYI